MGSSSSSIDSNANNANNEEVGSNCEYNKNHFCGATCAHFATMNSLRPKGPVNGEGLRNNHLSTSVLADLEELSTKNPLIDVNGKKKHFNEANDSTQCGHSCSHLMIDHPHSKPFVHLPASGKPQFNFEDVKTHAKIQNQIKKHIDNVYKSKEKDICKHIDKLKKEVENKLQNDKKTMFENVKYTPLSQPQKGGDDIYYQKYLKYKSKYINGKH